MAALNGRLFNSGILNKTISTALKYIILKSAREERRMLCEHSQEIACRERILFRNLQVCSFCRPKLYKEAA